MKKSDAADANKGDVMKLFLLTTAAICLLGAPFSIISARAIETFYDNVTIKDTFLSATSLSLVNSSNNWYFVNNFLDSGELSIANAGGGVPDTRVPFLIEFGAPDASFTIGSEGKIGIGSTTPGGAHDAILTLSETEDAWAAINFEGVERDFVLLNDNSGILIIDVEAFTAPFHLEWGAPDETFHIHSSGNIGFGTNSPSEKLHLLNGNLKVEQSAINESAVIDFATRNSNWEIKQNGQTGRLTFFSPGGGATTASFKFDRLATENLFRVGVLGSNIVDINGSLLINGDLVVPDYIFDTDYQIESIEEHAELMWKHKHLPAMPTVSEDDGGVDILRQQFGTLEELEKAHIYINQLNEELKDLRAKHKKISLEQEGRIAKLELALSEVLGSRVPSLKNSQ